ncbi:NACHT domain-containing protein [Streptomyces sodiiphilus]|uniref:NACHT domain-containing protein n=1 Tax=Streptomyces sodiiphilus TaxID=226217 RepID=A0ABP5ABJ0_9ACTN
MDAGTIGLRLGSAAIGPLLKKLLRREEPGAGLVDRPVRISSLLNLGPEPGALNEKQLRKLTAALVERAAEARGPHEAPDIEIRSEVTDALVSSLRACGDLSMDDVQAVSLGAEGLAARVRSRPDALSAGALALYDPLLTVLCLHIIDHFTRRSTFIARTLVEQSRRITGLVEHLDTLAARLPPQTAEDIEFESRYAAHIIRRYGQLTIHGIDVEDEWPLDDAYLSLETTSASGTSASHDREGGRAALADAPPPAPRRAEAALAGKSRVLLRGAGGSGKTTLVQWLAVTTARGEFEAGSPLRKQLTGRVPLVLPLRRLTRHGADLPLPGALLAAAGCPHTPPDGWVERVLNAGRGLLLVDGIDEVPEDERAEVRRWLISLVRDFPDNLWLVTARPSAVRHDWLAGDGFTDLSLAPMSREDTTAFVRRWHTATRTDEETCADLLDVLRRRPDLARLATNPLMCGLVCALHRTRRGHLPRGRQALYEAGLHMLLERRNQERKVRSAIELDAPAQILLLQRLAYWLIRNGRTEMEREDAVEVIADALPSMPHASEQGDAEAVYRFLLDRSGLLREPAEGAVDFVHRTFQDYLAAKAAVEGRDIPWLVGRAHLDQFEDVVRMAVAHGRPAERDRLLKQLIQRGDRVKKHRIRLHLLAVACLEHAPELSPEIRELVTDRATSYLPPRTFEEAESLAAAGPVVLDLLPGPDRLTEEEATSVVSTAALIAGDRALPVLRRFVALDNHGVHYELSNHWSSFEAGQYYAEIMSRLPRDKVTFSPWDEKSLKCTLATKGIQLLSVPHETSETQLDQLLTDRQLNRLDLSKIQLTDVSPLSRLRSLNTLILDVSRLPCGIEALHPLGLEALILTCEEKNPPPDALRGLSGFDGLRLLTVVGNVPLDSLAEIPRTVDRLTLPSEPPSLEVVETKNRLSYLGLQYCVRPLSRKECETIASFPRLEVMVINRLTLHSLAESGTALPRIQQLYAWATGNSERITAKDLAFVNQEFPGLTRLHLVGPFESLEPLKDHPRLETVRLLNFRGPVPAPRDGLEVITEPASRY